jgi:hypothetical protein
MTERGRKKGRRWKKEELCPSKEKKPTQIVEEKAVDLECGDFKQKRPEWSPHFSGLQSLPKMRISACLGSNDCHSIPYLQKAKHWPASKSEQERPGRFLTSSPALCALTAPQNQAGPTQSSGTRDPGV